VIRDLVPLVLGVLLTACSAAGSPGSAVSHSSQTATGPPASSVERSSRAASAMPESASTPSASATPGTNMTPVPGGVPVILSIGDHAQVVTYDLNLRSQPWVGPDSRTYEPLLQRGNGLWVLGGPVAGSGYWWYHVALATKWVGDTSGEGWVASAARDGTPWVASEPFAEPSRSYRVRFGTKLEFDLGF